MTSWHWVRGGLSGNPRLYKHSPPQPSKRVAEVACDGRSFALYIAQDDVCIYDAPRHSTHNTEAAACAEAVRVLGAPADLRMPIAWWDNPPVKEEP